MQHDSSLLPTPLVVLWNSSKSDIVCQRILNLTFKSLINDLFPDSMANLFKRPSHRYSTRAKTNFSLTLPRAKTNAGKRRFSYMAPTMGNSIPGHLHLITSPKVFLNTLYLVLKYQVQAPLSTAIGNCYRTQYRETILTNCQLNFF